MNNNNQVKPLVWALLIAFLLLWFITLGTRTLVPTDEGRYAEIAREMAATKDWITPRLNGTKYFEKPPLQYWMNALTFDIFGVGEWQARLWTGLCGLFGIALAGLAGRKVFGPRVGLTAAAVLASSFYWYAMGHINSLDMGLSAMMTLALCGLLIAQREDATAGERRNWMLACWAGMALATMSKGLMGVVLPGAVLVLYTLISRDWGIWKRLHALAGLAVFFIITVPWFVLVSLKNPEFAHFFFIHEHFERFTSKVHNRAGPWHFFFPILILGILPWTAVLPQSLWAARKSASPAGVFQPKTLLLTWTIFIFAFFSLSGSKLPSYILPVFPALALLIAIYLEQSAADRPGPVMLAGAVLAILGAVGLAVAVIRVPAMAGDTFEAPLFRHYAKWIMAAGAIAIAGSLLTILLARRRRDLAILTLAGAGFLSALTLLSGHEPFGRYAAGVEHLPALRAELGPQTPLYAVGRYEQVLPVYLQRTMILVGHTDEMSFGLRQEPHLWIPEKPAFIRIWNAERAAGHKIVAIMGQGSYEEFVRAGVPMRVISQDPRRVIVASDGTPTPPPKNPS